jgi:hypothetical protein
MSVNGLGCVSRAHMTSRGEERAHPSNFRAIVYTTYTYKVINKPTGRSYLQKMEKRQFPITKYLYLVSLPRTKARYVTHHKAVAAKHIVLPTYIGSWSTLNGKPSTRESMRMPK